MHRYFIATCAVITATTAVFADGHATGDAAEGEQVFKQCRSCHMVVDGDGNEIQRGGRTGPNLFGVFERTAGSIEEFNYSDYMVEAGEAGLNWNEAEFVAYVQDPTGYLKAYLEDSSARGKMAFRARSEEDASNVWAYLVSVGPEPES